MAWVMGPLDALAGIDLLQVPVVDAQGGPLTSGVVLFCPQDAPCLEFPISPTGSISLDSSLLEPAGVYAVLIYGDDLAVRFATYGWVYGGDTTDPDAEPVLRGVSAQQLEVVLPPPPPPPADPVAAAAADDDGQTEDFPRFLGGVMVPFMLGGAFGTDADALSGVTDVSPGFGVIGCYRFGYPVRRNLGRTSVTFQELSLAYAQNRYHLEPVQPSGAGSDLTFHRFYGTFGLGRQWQRSQGVLAAAASYGGIYDGSELLEYRDRSYGMFGLGLQGRYVWRMVGGNGRLALGLLGQVELMYYFADHGDNDHWYGWAPSASVGLMVF